MGAIEKRFKGIVYLASMLLAGAGIHNAWAQPIKFSPVEKRIILPSNVQPFESIAADASGNIFFPSNNQIVKVSPSGVINTISSGLTLPDDVKTDAAGNVYVADNGTNQLVKITPSGVQTVVASGLNLGLDIQNLTFDFRDFILDGSGNIFISDNPAKQVVKVSPSGSRTVIASGFAPENIALDASGNVYVTDVTNNRAVKIAPSGTQTVIASGLNTPGSIAVDASGNVFLINSDGQCCVNNQVLRVTPSGARTVAFEGLSSTGELAQGVAVDGSGNLYVGLALGGGGGTGIIELQNTTTAFGEIIFGGNFAAGSGSPLVQPVTFTFNSTVTVGKVQVLTNGALSQDFQSASGGTCAAGTFTAGQKCKVNAQFVPTQAGARLGALVLSDSAGNPLSTVNLNGIGVLPAAALTPGALKLVPANGLLDPSAVALDGLGNTFIVDKGNSRVIRLSPSGVQTTIGQGLSSPTGAAEDGAGNVYISDTANERVVKVKPNGNQTVVLSGLNTPEGIAVDGAGNLYVADAGNNRVLKLAVDGVTQSTVGTGYSRPTGITVDGVGNVFVADFGNDRIEEVMPDGTQSTVVGNLSFPSGVAVDAVGNLYVAEVGTNDVIEVTPLSGGGTQTTVLSAGLNFPFDAVLVAVNGSGNVFIADTFNNRVLQLDRSQSNLNFGTVATGQTVTKPVTLSSVGPRIFSVENAFTLTATGQSFQLVQTTSPDDCLLTRLLRGSCTLQVAFKPTGQGSVTGTVTITDLAGTQIIHLSGTGN
jgi:sugar lactone lactonase YvrE